MRVASIDKKAFNRILGPLQEILKRNVGKYEQYLKN